MNESELTFDTALASIIDHTLLKPEATPHDIEQLCAEALRYHFASVCINPSFVKLCAQILRGKDVKVCTVIGFPLGATSTESKVQEARIALQNGAQEIDMVMHIGMLKAHEEEYVQKDIHSVVATALKHQAITKVIIETALLTDEEKVLACTLASKAGASFVKTSTGFSRGGATVEDVALMRKTVGTKIGVKASGGIRTREQALSLVNAGANRIGASASINLVTNTNSTVKTNY